MIVFLDGEEVKRVNEDLYFHVFISVEEIIENKVDINIITKCAKVSVDEIGKNSTKCKLRSCLFSLHYVN